MDIEIIIDDLLNGGERGFGENIRKLEADRRAAIRFLLSILAGETNHRPRPGVHPVDWSDNGTMAISILGRDESPSSSIY